MSLSERVQDLNDQVQTVTKQVERLEERQELQHEETSRRVGSLETIIYGALIALAGIVLCAVVALVIKQ